MTVLPPRGLILTCRAGVVTEKRAMTRTHHLGPWRLADGDGFFVEHIVRLLLPIEDEVLELEDLVEVLLLEAEPVARGYAKSA